MPAQADSAILPGYVESEGQDVQPHNWSVSGVSVQHRDNFLEQESSPPQKKSTITSPPLLSLANEVD